MKLKIDWKELGKQLWNVAKPVLLAAIGGGVVTLADGCSSLTPSAKTRFACDEVVRVPERESANPEGAARGRVDEPVRDRHTGHRDRHAVGADRRQQGRRRQRAGSGESRDDYDVAGEVGRRLLPRTGVSSP